jgi:hypothetical protein
VRLWEIALGYRVRHWLIIAFLASCVAVDFCVWMTGLNLKLSWAYLSTAITITGYCFYLSQMYPPPGGTPAKPEPLTWVLFGFLTGTGWLIQVAQGAQAGSWCLGISAFACFIIAGWSFLKFKWTFDIFHGAVAIGALALFGISLFARNNPHLAMASAITATVADLVSYGPTFKKAWRHPDEDSVTNFVFNSVKCIPALLALQSYSVATMIYLLMLTIVNGGFAVFLLFRRWQIAA